MLSAGPPRRRAGARRPVPRRRRHRVDRVRGRARRAAAPRAHGRGPARDGQHARRPHDPADAGALGVHRRRQAQQRSAEPHAHVYIRAPYGVFATSDGFLALAFADLHELGRLIGEPAFEGWTARSRVDPPRRDPRQDRGEAAREARAALARDARRRRHLGRPGLRLRGPRRRPADRAQRHVRRVRPPDRGPREDPGLPVSLLADAPALYRGRTARRASTRARSSPRPGSTTSASRPCSPRAAAAVDRPVPAGRDGALSRSHLGPPARPAGARARSGDGDGCRGERLIDWDAQPLEGFESSPIEELAARYDLIVLDHPHLGDASPPRRLRPLDTLFAAELLEAWRATRSGRVPPRTRSTAASGRSRSMRPRRSPCSVPELVPTAAAHLGARSPRSRRVARSR